MNKKIYHIEIIHERGSISYLEDRKITADQFSISDAGLYSFYLEGKLIACYPIVRTIISSIEEEK
jgi:hypothetical protein